MIISASRRTDIPAFYSQWFMNRIQAGYCTVPNPFNRKQVSYVSLEPEDVEVIVFWTRNPAPLLPYLPELDNRGYRYYFQYTILDYPKKIDQKTPPLDSAIKTFTRVSDHVGPDRVIWRYDPILFTEKTGASYHLDKFSYISEALHGYTRRSVISIMDVYKKTRKRLRNMGEQGYETMDVSNTISPRFERLMRDLKSVANDNGMEIVSCAEELDLTPYGIASGKCVDDILIQRVFNINITQKKDPNQRQVCGCVVSKDIGMYDTCLFGCQYCYATKSFDLARRQNAEHDPDSPSLVGWYDAQPPRKTSQPELL